MNLSQKLHTVGVWTFSTCDIDIWLQSRQQLQWSMQREWERHQLDPYHGWYLVWLAWSFHISLYSQTKIYQTNVDYCWHWSIDYFDLTMKHDVICWMESYWQTLIRKIVPIRLMTTILNPWCVCVFVKVRFFCMCSSVDTPKWQIVANERITTRNLNEKYRMECDRGEGHQTDRLTMRVVFFEGKTGFQSLLSVDICLGAKLYLHNIRKRRRKRFVCVCVCVCVFVCMFTQKEGFGTWNQTGEFNSQVGNKEVAVICVLPWWSSSEIYKNELTLSMVTCCNVRNRTWTQNVPFS